MRKIPELDEQTVIAVKAPSQTKVEISDPEEVRGAKKQFYFAVDAKLPMAVVNF